MLKYIDLCFEGMPPRYVSSNESALEAAREMVLQALARKAYEAPELYAIDHSLLQFGRSAPTIWHTAPSARVAGLRHPWEIYELLRKYGPLVCADAIHYGPATFAVAVYGLIEENGVFKVRYKDPKGQHYPKTSALHLFRDLFTSPIIQYLTTQQSPVEGN